MEKIIYNGLAISFFNPDNFEDNILKINNIETIVAITNVDNTKIGIYFDNMLMVTLYYANYKDIINDSLLSSLTLFGEDEELFKLENEIMKNAVKSTSFKLQH